MRKILGLLLCFVIIIVIINSFIGKEQLLVSPSTSTPTPPVSTQEKITKAPASSLFVPYWSVGNTVFPSSYDRLYYFGVAANAEGIVTTESGYKNISKFLRLVPAGKEKYLVIRMTDSQTNSNVLRDKTSQQKIIEGSLTVAIENRFDGIVLDFEINALSFDSVIKEISAFMKEFGNKARNKEMPFLITLYGDTYYRLRPYDVKTIARDSNGVLIMTYDFHKANGAPGPNFPLSGKQTYGYDITTMVDDFSKDIPVEKITVVLGMFGYDWQLDSKNNSVGTARAVTLNEATQKFINTCVYKNCKVTKDEKSKETRATYTDDTNQNHVVWFETKESYLLKKDYLKSRGINAISLWAYSYF